MKYLVLLLVLFSVACHSSAPPPYLKLEYKVSPQPPRAGAATIDLKLTDKQGQPVSGARVELEGNMTHPGMSPVTGKTREIESGKYRGTLELPMAGDWIVLVHITLVNGQQVQRQFEISGVV